MSRADGFPSFKKLGLDTPQAATLVYLSACLGMIQSTGSSKIGERVDGGSVGGSVQFKRMEVVRVIRVATAVINATDPLTYDPKGANVGPHKPIPATAVLIGLAVNREYVSGIAQKYGWTSVQSNGKEVVPTRQKVAAVEYVKALLDSIAVAWVEAGVVVPAELLESEEE